MLLALPCLAWHMAWFSAGLCYLWRISNCTVQLFDKTMDHAAWIRSSYTPSVLSVPYGIMDYRARSAVMGSPATATATTVLRWRLASLIQLTPMGPDKEPQISLKICLLPFSTFCTCPPSLVSLLFELLSKEGASF
jgi:hypothetical protein